MKDKIYKKNMTSFDYKARRLGIIGSVIIILSLAILLPICTSISSQNVAITEEIRQLNNEIDTNSGEIETNM